MIIKLIAHKIIFLIKSEDTELNLYKILSIKAYSIINFLAKNKI